MTSLRGRNNKENLVKAIVHSKKQIMIINLNQTEKLIIEQVKQTVLVLIGTIS